jgi:hypothetical protein
MALSGIDGYVKVGAAPSVAYGLSKWKVSFKTNLPNTSGFKSQGYHDNVKGKTMATVTCSGAYDGAMPFICGNVYEFHLGFSATVELVVSARISDLSPANDYEDKPTLDITAESSGVIVAQVV